MIDLYDYYKEIENRIVNMVDRKKNEAKSNTRKNNSR